jgi:hypothetical protein
MMTVKYSLVEKSGFHDNHWTIKIDEGDYEGVMYQYDTVSFEESEDGDVILQFNTITVDNPKNYDLTTSEFENTIGDILTTIIQEQLDEMEKNGNDGNGDTESPNE